MTLLIQITDTHILPPGEVLYGSVDTALHLKEKDWWWTISKT